MIGFCDRASLGYRVPQAMGIELPPARYNIRKEVTAISEKLIFDFHTMLILPIACLVAFSGCSGIEGTAEKHRVTTNLLNYIEEDHEKPQNPRVHPGQPYDRGLPELERD
jgi:hypothetical protein